LPDHCWQTAPKPSHHEFDIPQPFGSKKWAGLRIAEFFSLAFAASDDMHPRAAPSKSGRQNGLPCFTVVNVKLVRGASAHGQDVDIGYRAVTATQPLFIAAVPDLIGLAV
jgi:hypothetical protein